VCKNKNHSRSHNITTQHSTGWLYAFCCCAARLKLYCYFFVFFFGRPAEMAVWIRSNFSELRTRIVNIYIFICVLYCVCEQHQQHHYQRRRRTENVRVREREFGVFLSAMAENEENLWILAERHGLIMNILQKIGQYYVPTLLLLRSLFTN